MDSDGLFLLKSLLDDPPKGFAALVVTSPFALVVSVSGLLNEALNRAWIGFYSLLIFGSAFALWGLLQRQSLLPLEMNQVLSDWRFYRCRL